MTDIVGVAGTLRADEVVHERSVIEVLGVIEFPFQIWDETVTLWISVVIAFPKCRETTDAQDTESLI